ncbi:sterile alpha motif domain-containing protein 9-like [Puntigrus tetrazona]|uniref:sterile alpha motif domain-containing protein 9-like n=1 Tax=Puntigrus tetrazona TaxID=1606681 RepID=UPI001C890FAD|nr:sterile alpha motif domain-containing protein 9-like [Puntigrus tetrazona]
MDGNSKENKRPEDMSDWNRDHVRQWLLEIKIDKKHVDKLYDEGLNGAGLFRFKEVYRLMRDLSSEEQELISQKIDLSKEELNDVSQACCLKPYPFSRYDASYRYIENSILDVTETGPKDLIQPCHEFKAFTKTKEYAMQKYTYEVIRFAAACMNSRTNGTIHFGVSDKPHGLILGVEISKNDDFNDQQIHAIERNFKSKRKFKQNK